MHKAFQSSLPRRERRSGWTSIIQVSQFQSTLPRRERHHGGERRPNDIRISILAPAKGATVCTKIVLDIYTNFNPRSREGSDLRLVRKCRFTYRFQSTLPRRERRPISSGDQTPYCISIHAPAKGATKNNSWKCRYWGISIHAPAKGATCNGLRMLKKKQFQSTLPRRERHEWESQKASETYISIHAPAKGATLCNETTEALVCISIHAPAKGATRCCKIFGAIPIFQSTLPRRERHLLQI